MSIYRKKEELTESQKEALSKIERKAVEQGEVISEQSLRIKELEGLLTQRENELAQLRKNYELEVKKLNDMVTQLQRQSDDQISKIESVEHKMKDETDSIRYKEEEMQFKMRGLEKKITDLENEAKRKEERIEGLNQELGLSEERVTELEKKLQEKDAKLDSIESIIGDDANYKPYLIVKKYGSSSIQDIKKTLGLQEGVVRRIVLELEKKGLLRIDGEQIHLA